MKCLANEVCAPLLNIAMKIKMGYDVVKTTYSLDGGQCVGRSSYFGPGASCNKLMQCTHVLESHNQLIREAPIKTITAA